ncbi:hypothetical protein [Dyella choica]|uniref:Uncharacterized protein n=1 Tax=Dyella choica TaxID=1927959 RepID=A0A3S0PP76_9GAMM|nr:hypothetical protein [Dyella choica]RUL78261.1 hypothetical protein EKH80_05365 [Dyella choica]
MNKRADANENEGSHHAIRIPTMAAMKSLAWLAAGLLVSWAGQAQAADAAEICTARLADVKQPLKFEDFPVPRASSSPITAPRLDSPEARRYRTVIREGTASGPNFAGHFAVVAWGCGSSCSERAIVDTQTGQVFFDRRLRDLDTTQADANGDRDEQFPAYFSLSSRLLVIVGAPNEDESHDGVAFYEWTGSQLKLLRFVPRLQACVRQPVSE